MLASVWDKYSCVDRFDTAVPVAGPVLARTDTQPLPQLSTTPLKAMLVLLDLTYTTLSRQTVVGRDTRGTPDVKAACAALATSTGSSTCVKRFGMTATKTFSSAAPVAGAVAGADAGAAGAAGAGAAGTVAWDAGVPTTSNDVGCSFNGLEAPSTATKNHVLGCTGTRLIVPSLLANSGYFWRILPTFLTLTRVPSTRCCSRRGWKTRAQKATSGSKGKGVRSSRRQANGGGWRTNSQ